MSCITHMYTSVYGWTCHLSVHTDTDTDTHTHKHTHTHTYTHTRSRGLHLNLGSQKLQVKISKIVYFLLKQFSTLKVTKIHESQN